MRVIGTAGHVDHGKSTLVKALTGIDPDRLKEEKEREMTIDLGFAWLKLPNEEIVSIVDVPGHEDFIRNMLAGVGGIDLALLVIAADESVMPQTQEHLHILDLLNVPRGIVALTKVDLVEEEDWLELVELDITEALEGTALEGAPIVQVAAREGKGVQKLISVLTQILADSEPRADLGRPRLSVDRVFSVLGFGTVVTGTLLDGAFGIGDEIVLLPSGKTGRIRGLQTHKEKVERATPGRRLAVNISGLDVSDVSRGALLAHPDDYQPTRLVDVSLRVLSDLEHPLRHNQEVEFFSGAAQKVGYLRLIGKKELLPGSEGFAQIRLIEPMVMARGDRYILRQPSPSRTIGGGQILDPFPPSRWRRSRPETLERFELLAKGSPVDLLVQKLITLEPANKKQLLAVLPLSSDVANHALAEAIQEKQVRHLPDGTLLSATGWSRRQEYLLTAITAYHKSYPLRLGLPREEVASRLKLKPKVAAAFLETLVEAKAIQLGNDWVALPGFEVNLSAKQQRKIDNLLQQFHKSPYTPPSSKNAIALIGEELLAYMVARGDLVRLNQDVLLSHSAYNKMREGIGDLFAQHGEIKASAVRDHFKTSRKYAIALLEYLDALKITRRIGDKRILRR